MSLPYLLASTRTTFHRVANNARNNVPDSRLQSVRGNADKNRPGYRLTRDSYSGRESR